MMTNKGACNACALIDEERPRLSLFVLVYDSSMASFDSSLTEADCVVQVLDSPPVTRRAGPYGYHEFAAAAGLHSVSESVLYL